VITIDVEVLIASLRTATNPPAGHGPSPYSANVTFLETSIYDSDNRMAETSLDFGLVLPPIYSAPRAIRPALLAMSWVIRRLLNPFSWMQRKFNRAILSLVCRLQRHAAQLESEVTRQRHLIIKLEKTLAFQAQSIATLERRLEVSQPELGATPHH
jgi:hypothetical protein